MISIVLIWIVYYALHSISATYYVKHRFKLIDERPKLSYRLIYSAFSLITFGIAFYFHRKLDPGHFFFHSDELKFGGLIIQAIGLVVLYYSFKAYSLPEFLGFIKAQKHELVAGGMNGLVRHPIYFATLIILLGYLLYEPTRFNLVFFNVSTIYLYIGSWFEEQRLIDEFGESYLHYKKRVKRILPYIF